MAAVCGRGNRSAHPCGRRGCRIAEGVREPADTQLDPEKGAFADDIIYMIADGPSPYAHPLCANTWRNGRKLGDEAPAIGY